MSSMKRKTQQKRGPGRPPGRNWRALMLSITPDREAAALSVGPTPAKGIYALLDFAARNPALVAKINSQRDGTPNGNSDA